MSHPDEKRLAVEHAESYACVSESARRDLLELEPASNHKAADVVLLASDFATLLSTAAASDTADDRNARQARWEPRRQAQALTQHGLIAPYHLRVEARTPAHRPGVLEQWWKAGARRYLPSWVLKLLRDSRSRVRRSLARRRRSIAG